MSRTRQLAKTLHASIISPELRQQPVTSLILEIVDALRIELCLRLGNAIPGVRLTEIGVKWDGLAHFQISFRCRCYSWTPQELAEDDLVEIIPWLLSYDEARR